MTGKELAAYIGTGVTLTTREGLRVDCQVTDSRINYGKLQLEVEPLKGSGSAWVDAERTTRTDTRPQGEKGKA